MMLFPLISVLLLLPYSAPQDVIQNGTTTAITSTTTEITTAATPEIRTTTTETAALVTTTTVPTTTAKPEGDCCDNFITTGSPTSPLLPSENLIFRASCSCKTKKQAICPVVTVTKDTLELITYKEDLIEHTRNICVIAMAIKPRQGKFISRSVEVHLTVLGLEEERLLSARFLKSENGGKCEEDLDCWRSLDQMCDEGRCSCYRDVPSFVQTEGRCFAASKYGENCKYDVQCWSSDNDTICCDDKRRCKCKKDYWIRSDSDPICITTAKNGENCKYDEQCKSNDNNTICNSQTCKCKDGYGIQSGSDPTCNIIKTSFSAKVIANQRMVYFTAISSVILFSLMM